MEAERVLLDFAHRLWGKAVSFLALNTHDCVHLPALQHVDRNLCHDPCPLRAWNWRGITGIPGEVRIVVKTLQRASSGNSISTDVCYPETQFQEAMGGDGLQHILVDSKMDVIKVVKVPDAL